MVEAWSATRVCCAVPVVILYLIICIMEIGGRSISKQKSVDESAWDVLWKGLGFLVL